MIGLTKNQRRLLTYLREYIGQNGEAPTFDEIRVALGIPSKSQVFGRMNALQERGYLTRSYGKTRDITLLDPPIVINGERYRFIPITPGVVNPLRKAA